MQKLRFLAVLMVFVVVATVMAAAAGRDWEKYPAYLEITGAKKVYAIGDVHGAFDEFSAALSALKVATRTAKDSFRFNWTAEDAVLVITGDLTDRGLYSKQTYDAVMDLQEKARQAGGQVIVTMGNHEVMLLNGQVEEWAKTLTSYKKQHYQNTIDSFTRDGLDYHQAISENGVYGRWIRNLPLFAVINGFMFVHGGFPNKPVTRSTLAADFKDDINRGDFKKGIFMNMENVLWNRDWWKDDALVNENLKVLGVMGVIFGHTTKAMGSPGKIIAKDDRLIAIDIGMTPSYGYSKGGGLEISIAAGDQLVFRAVYPDAPEEMLFSVKMPASAYSQPVRNKERALSAY
ncbi:MAG: metallophosphoesterase [Candidatus Riflebacteria bacterium]|nr:metallophosphoesterase [Candidatus Riflebacteria bacterium]